MPSFIGLFFDTQKLLPGELSFQKTPEREKEEEEEGVSSCGSEVPHPPLRSATGKWRGGL